MPQPVLQTASPAAGILALSQSPLSCASIVSSGSLHLLSPPLHQFQTSHSSAQLSVSASSPVSSVAATAAQSPVSFMNSQPPPSFHLAALGNKSSVDSTRIPADQVFMTLSMSSDADLGPEAAKCMALTGAATKSSISDISPESDSTVTATAANKAAKFHSKISKNKGRAFSFFRILVKSL
jgi:hypothetical protein